MVWLDRDLRAHALRRHAAVDADAVALGARTARAGAAVVEGSRASPARCALAVPRAVAAAAVAGVLLRALAHAAVPASAVRTDGAARRAAVARGRPRPAALAAPAGMGRATDGDEVGRALVAHAQGCRSLGRCHPRARADADPRDRLRRGHGPLRPAPASWARHADREDLARRLAATPLQPALRRTPVGRAGRARSRCRVDLQADRLARGARAHRGLRLSRDRAGDAVRTARDVPGGTCTPRRSAR